MNTKVLNQLLSQKCELKVGRIQNVTWNVDKLKILKIRDTILLLNGVIIYEDLDHQIYISNMKGGFLRKNTAHTAFCLENSKLHIAIYANEGMINQHTCEDVINEIKKALSEFIK